jgi:PurA ssDNA and RNA-binding protein
MSYEEEGQRQHSNALHSEKILGDRKVFFLDLKENDRGRFIKITEDVRGRRDTIMLPIEVANDFAEALDRILEANAQMGGAPLES